MQIANSANPAFIQTASLVQGVPISSSLNNDVFERACRQYLKDRNEKPQGPGVIAYGLSLILGELTLRRVSNLTAGLGLGQFYPAERSYPVLPPDNLLAERYAPKLFTINENQSKQESLKPEQLRYEILPAQQGQNYYSIVYYVGLPTEQLPFPVLVKLYDWVRPILFGSRKDWEGIQIDINQDTQQPVGISFETSNYSDTPDTYDLVSRRDLHLYTRISKLPDGSWQRTVQQTNGKIQTSKVESPFVDSQHPEIAIVSWNTSFDVCNQVALHPELKLFDLEQPKLEFMDIDTYKKEGIDLRATWLNKRRLSNLILRLPKRVSQS